MTDGDASMNRRQFVMGMGAVAVSPLPFRAAAEEPLAVPSHRIVVKYGFSFVNRSGVLIPAARATCCAPVKACSSQRCVRVAASGSDSLSPDGVGNQFAAFALGALAPRAITLCRIQAEIDMGRRVADPSEQADANLFLAPDRWVPSGHPEIARAAQRLAKGGGDVARRLCLWVSGHLRKDARVRSSLGAVCALQTGRGDCTESATLFAALCRANGIPARVCGGFLVRGSAVLDPSGFHNWAEFHDGVGWRLADPNLGRFCEHEEQYVALLIWTGERSDTGLARTDNPALDVRMLG